MAQNGTVQAYQGSVTGQYITILETVNAAFAEGVDEYVFPDALPRILFFNLTVCSGLVADGPNFLCQVRGLYHVALSACLSYSGLGTKFSLLAYVNGVPVYDSDFNVFNGGQTAVTYFCVDLFPGDLLGFAAANPAADGTLVAFPASSANVAITKIF